MDPQPGQQPLIPAAVLRSGRLTGVLPDLLTNHVHILEMNGYSHRLKDSKRKRAAERSR